MATPGRPGHAKLNTELNQCEPTYQTLPDIASNGRLEDGVLINLQVNSWYTATSTGCTWANDWGLQTVATPNYTVGGSTCAAFQLDPTGQNASLPILGINLNDSQQRRCPTWTACPVGNNCCLAALTPSWGNGTAVAVRPDGTAFRYAMTGTTTVLKADGTPLRNVVDSASSYVTTVMRLRDGTVWTIGDNQLGALGNGATAKDSNVAVQVKIDPALGGGNLTGVEQVAQSAVSSPCARTTDGKVYCWGDDSANQIPDGAALDFNTNRYAYLIPLGTAKATQVVSGFKHAAAIMLDGTLRVWGGAPGKGACDSPALTNAICNPAPTLTDVIGVSAGDGFTCILRVGGTVWCMGLQDNGRLGDGTAGVTGVVKTTFAQVKTGASTYLTGVSQIISSVSQTCALSGTDGSVFCWGAGATGRVGSTNTSKSAYALPVQTAAGGTFTGFVKLDGASGWKSGSNAFILVCGRDANGVAWCWGDNMTFGIGDGTSIYASTPKRNIKVDCP